ncbi:hypothetical protein [Larkinella soli]|uniref:hypothetical protein n=1 Tax=Larkinella soli TaxID=1770527 RepID=UPI000FFBB31B|nr:hypothetical protein [Larkinella soli]
MLIFSLLPVVSDLKQAHTVGLVFLLTALSACVPEPERPGTARILEFKLDGVQGQATAIDTVSFEIRLTVASRTMLKGVRPLIQVSEGATVTPASGVPQNFHRPIPYSVADAGGKRVVYWVRTVLKD